MTAFLIAALALLGLTAVILVRPLLRGQPAPADAQIRRESNLAILRDQLAELEREQAEGMLAAPDFAQARDELKRRILEENDGLATDSQSGDRSPSRKVAALAVVLLVVSASLGYALLGNPVALDPAARVARQEPQMSPEQIEAMVAKLAARMEANPDDEQGWVMLARSYKVLGRPADAAKAYSHAEKLVATDASLSADYAEVLAMASDGGLKGKPAKLVEQALKLDPANPHALFLAGAVAMEAGKPTQAADYWEKLLPLVEPGSEIESLLKSSIEKIRAGATPNGKPAKP